MSETQLEVKELNQNVGNIIRCTICNEWIGILEGATVEIKCPDIYGGWNLICRQCIIKRKNKAYEKVYHRLLLENKKLRGKKE